MSHFHTVVIWAEMLLSNHKVKCYVPMVGSAKYPWHWLSLFVVSDCPRGGCVRTRGLTELSLNKTQRALSLIASLEKSTRQTPECQISISHKCKHPWGSLTQTKNILAFTWWLKHSSRHLIRQHMMMPVAVVTDTPDTVLYTHPPPPPPHGHSTLAQFHQCCSCSLLLCLASALSQKCLKSSRLLPLPLLSLSSCLPLVRCFYFLVAILDMSHSTFISWGQWCCCTGHSWLGS